jgi:peptidoglycan/LPS O-acetylase OafA/YrhL
MSDSAPTTRAPALPYWPAIDGVRAVSVVAVLLFHSGYTWAVGGYLGVSTFFTLSGFLITSLLLNERTATGRIDPKRFWARRFRRLLPAAMATLALAVVFGATLADPDQLRELRGDVIACLTYVANWRFLFSNQSYADLFASPSPVLHFWSLAIEEQFYVLFPLVVLGLFAVGRGSRRVLAGALGALIAGSVALSLFAGFSEDRIYFGTDTRAAELLVGALLAVAITGRRLPRAARAGATIAGPIALVALLWAMATAGQSDDGLYHGGFFVYALGSVVLVLAATLPTGPVVTVLSWRPLVALGKISYGVYLYHWLVFQWLTPTRTGLSGSGMQDATLFGLRTALTVALAAVSFVLLEQPIRRGRLLRGRTPFLVAPAAGAAIVAALLVVTVSPPPPLIDFDAAQAALADMSTSELAASGEVVVDPRDDLPTPPPPRVAMFGDSTAVMTSVGLGRWAESHQLAALTGGEMWFGCGTALAGERRNGPDAPVTSIDCNDWAETWPAAVEEADADLAVIELGAWEVTDLKLAGEDVWRSPGEREFDERLRRDFAEMTDVLAATGAHVVWLSSPRIGEGEKGDGITRRSDAAHPDRMDRVNDIMREVVAERSDVATIVDLAGWLDSTGEDIRLRPDGVHFSDETTNEVAERWLGAELVRLHREVWIEEWVAENGPPSPEPLRVLLVGDSTAFMLGWGLSDFVQREGTLDFLTRTEFGCGLAIDGRTRYQGASADIGPDCRELWEEWTRTVDAFDPQVVMVLTGPWDVADHQLPGDDAWVAPGDAVYDEYLHDQFQAATDLLSARGAMVLWLSSPIIDSGRQMTNRPADGFPESDPERMERLNELILEIVASDPYAELGDYAGRLRTYPGGELDSTLRPDGIHLANDQSHLIGDWLGPETIALYERWVVERWIADATAELQP